MTGFRTSWKQSRNILDIIGDPGSVAAVGECDRVPYAAGYLRLGPGKGKMAFAFKIPLLKH